MLKKAKDKNIPVLSSFHAAVILILFLVWNPHWFTVPQSLYMFQESDHQLKS